jgi:hypothetical protein
MDGNVSCVVVFDTFVSLCLIHLFNVHGVLDSVLNIVYLSLF